MDMELKKVHPERGVFWLRSTLPADELSNGIDLLESSLKERGYNIFIIHTPMELEIKDIEPKELAGVIPPEMFFKMGYIRLSAVISLMLQMNKMAIKIDSKIIEKVEAKNYTIEVKDNYTESGELSNLSVVIKIKKSD